MFWSLSKDYSRIIQEFNVFVLAQFKLLFVWKLFIAFIVRFLSFLYCDVIVHQFLK